MSELITWRDPRPGVAAVMLHSLQGFLDAGSAGRLAVERILAECPNRIVAEFDVDDLYDYRARRPRMTFLSDHYGQVDLPQLAVHEVSDLTGTPFLLLHGPEPDFRWQRFVAAVRHVVDELKVQRVVGMHAVPWPAPHTRPVGITAHATDRSMIPDATSWVGALEVPGHVAGMLELSLGEHGHDAMGFAAHVPHYLVNVEYPRAALALLEATAASTGLVLPFDALRESAARSDAEIAAQVASDPDNVEAVQAMEAQYDALIQQRGLPVVDEELPSGDEIAAQVEQFLADRRDGEPQ